MKKRHKILIVDDTPSNIKILSELLSEDYKIFFATNGEDAVSIAQSELPDLILLDIIMPGMDGYEVCRILKKEDSRTCRIPVIFITSLSQQEDEKKGLEVGAIDYVIKPFSLPIVKIRVKNHLDLKEYNDFLEDLSMRDGLTGIHNRRRFNDYLKQEWRRALRSKRPVAIIMIDIDLFKQYNDTYGHLEGDDCLRRVAEAMNSCLKRASDMIARYGGEEFACILPETDVNGAFSVAESLRQKVFGLSIPHISSTVSKFVTISSGVSAKVPTLNIFPEDIIKKADNLLYEAKRSGRNCIKYSD
ncbi:MAG: diguanylate cyclase [Desulfobacterales bacterium]|nr:diguanylate cyclase [Desulfobacterales bacterium]